MSITGEELIARIAQRLDEEDIRCYDSAIVTRIKYLTSSELNQLVSLGDVIQWHNDRVNNEHAQKA